MCAAYSKVQTEECLLPSWCKHSPKRTYVIGPFLRSENAYISAFSGHGLLINSYSLYYIFLKAEHPVPSGYTETGMTVSENTHTFTSPKKRIYLLPPYYAYFVCKKQHQNNHRHINFNFNVLWTLAKLRCVVPQIDWNSLIFTSASISFLLVRIQYKYQYSGFSNHTSPRPIL